MLFLISMSSENSRLPLVHKALPLSFPKNFIAITFKKISMHKRAGGFQPARCFRLYKALLFYAYS